MAPTSQNWQWKVVGGAAEFLFLPRAASIHEARCRLRQGAKPAFECRKCGRQFAQHFGRAKRLAHEQYCLGSAVANLTCRQCGEIFCSHEC